MTAGPPLPETAGATVFEIDRFEWTAPDRIEIAGVWSGVRGRRFMRPTLVLEREGEQKRMLALLDHKPWAADDGTEWMAAFAWDGPIEKFRSSELNVAPGLDLKLPSPRMRQGKPRRFKQRVVARDAVREAEAAAPSGGIVSEVPASAEAAAAQAKVAPEPAPDPKPAPEPEAAAAPDSDATHVESLRLELDRARTDRDEARAQVRALRTDIEQERQERERAVAEARREERDRATAMLAEGAELRAAVERQRELAYGTRDAAEHARDEAIAARDKAVAAQEEAIRLRKQAEREREHALFERDRAFKERDQAFAAREKARAERDAALQKRDEADAERNTILSLHERGLPVHEPEPRFLPKAHEPRSDVEIWLPRAIAVGLLVLFAFVVLHLLAGI